MLKYAREGEKTKYVRECEVCERRANYERECEVCERVKYVKEGKVRKEM
jgi:hypothetical protein